MPSTNKNRGKLGQKSSSKAFPHFFSLLGSCVWGERLAWGGGGIRREVVEVREGSRVVWIEETQRNMKHEGMRFEGGK